MLDLLSSTAWPVHLYCSLNRLADKGFQLTSLYRAWLTSSERSIRRPDRGFRVICSPFRPFVRNRDHSLCFAWSSPKAELGAGAHPLTGTLDGEVVFLPQPTGQ